MRIINLDETGIKIIASTKKQMYLSLPEVNSFLDGEYVLEANTLSVARKKISLSDTDIEEIPNIIRYIKSNFTKR